MNTNAPGAPRRSDGRLDATGSFRGGRKVVSTGSGSNGPAGKPAPRGRPPLEAGGIGSEGRRPVEARSRASKRPAGRPIIVVGAAA